MSKQGIKEKRQKIIAVARSTRTKKKGNTPHVQSEEEDLKDTMEKNIKISEKSLTAVIKNLRKEIQERNTKNDNNEKQQQDSDDNYKATTDKEQPTSKPNKGTKNEANKQNDDYDHDYTLDSNMFITGTSLNVGIENLRKEIQKQNIFLANTGALNDILQRGSDWTNVYTLFNTTEDIQNYNRLFIFTTFTGKHTAGHWHLTIIERQDTETRGYIIDSYGQNQDRIETSKAIRADLFTISEWEYIDTPKQFELKCHFCFVVFDVMLWFVVCA